MKRRIPFARPDITELEIAAVTDVLRSGWLTTGSQTKEFESRFAKRVGAQHAVAVNSCTAALHLALEAVGVGPGDEVIIPTMTFAATGEVVQHLDALPILVDVLESDHTLDPSAVERAMSARTRAVIPVHFAGKACHMREIMELASEASNCVVIEDAAHALPAACDGATIGGLGDITCFSFYATKTLTTGEGGMATTDNGAWVERMRMMSLHGISHDAWRRYSDSGHWYYEIINAGYKYNISDIASALGLSQLARLDDMHSRRRAIAAAYRAGFAENEAIELLDPGNESEHAWHLFVIKVIPEVLSCDRDTLISQLNGAGIGTSVHFIPLHMHPHYRNTFGYNPTSFPTALDCYQRSISLPIYSNMKDEEVERVISIVNELTNSL